MQSYSIQPPIRNGSQCSQIFKKGAICGWNQCDSHDSYGLSVVRSDGSDSTRNQTKNGELNKTFLHFLTMFLAYLMIFHCLRSRRYLWKFEKSLKKNYVKKLAKNEENPCSTCLHPQNFQNYSLFHEFVVYTIFSFWVQCVSLLINNK